MRREYGTQVSILWRLAVISTLWGIWFHRNAIIFDNKQTSSMSIMLAVRAILLESRCFKGNIGCIKNTVEELTILKGLRIEVKVSCFEGSDPCYMVSSAAWMVEDQYRWLGLQFAGLFGLWRGLP